MPVRMMIMTGSEMTMPAEPGMARMSDCTMNDVCKASLKGAGKDGKAMHCPPGGAFQSNVLIAIPHACEW